LASEINLFSSLGRRFESQDLIIVWAGTNDYFDLVTQIQNGATPLTKLRTVGLNAANQITSNLADAVMRFADLGVKRMVFVNLPDLGKIPQFSGAPLLSAPAMQLTNAPQSSSSNQKSPEFTPRQAKTSSCSSKSGLQTDPSRSCQIRI